MDSGNEIREFLTSRRARITPEQSGLLGTLAATLDQAEPAVASDDA